MRLIPAFLIWLFVQAKVKLWFGTVNVYRGWRARRKLAAYVATLKPEQQAWANELRRKLQHSPATATAAVLRATASEIQIKHARLAEKVDRYAKANPHA